MEGQGEGAGQIPAEKPAWLRQLPSTGHGEAGGRLEGPTSQLLKWSGGMRPQGPRPTPEDGGGT